MSQIMPGSKQLKSDYKFVFGTDEGKRVLSDLCRSCGVLVPSYVPGQTAEETAFREGMRNTALMILTHLDETPERFLELTQEIHSNG